MIRVGGETRRGASPPEGYGVLTQPRRDEPAAGVQGAEMDEVHRDLSVSRAVPSTGEDLDAHGIQAGTRERSTTITLTPRSSSAPRCCPSTPASVSPSTPSR